MKLNLKIVMVAMFLMIFIPIKAYLELLVIFISIFSYYEFLSMNKKVINE